MRHLFLRITWAVIVSAGCRINTAQAQLLTPQIRQQLQAELDYVPAFYNVKGVAAAVILPDSSMWMGAAGLSTASPPDSLRPEMTFGIASLTKNFVSALTLRYVQQGLLQLDGPIGPYLPAWARVPAIDSTITIRQLLNHTNGLGNYQQTRGYRLAYFDSAATYTLPLRQLIGYFPPMAAAPGARYSYGNGSYVLLGAIIEHLRNQPFPDVIRQELLLPLGLQNTFFSYYHPWPAGLTEAHSWGNNRGVSRDITLESRNLLFSSYGPSGGLMSTPADVARWSRALFTGAVIDSARLVEMTTATPPFPSYGLGLIKISLGYGRFGWGHLGFIPGCLAIYVYEPTCNIGIAVMLNDDRAPHARRKIAWRLYNMVLRRPICNRPAPPLGVDDEGALGADPDYLDLQIAPNPVAAAEGATIHYTCPPGTRTASLLVRDATGRLVRSIQLSPVATTLTLATNGLPAGVYTCQLQLDNTQLSYTEQLVIAP